MNKTGLEINKTREEQFPFLKKGERCRNCDRREGSLCEVLTCEELDQMDEIMVSVKKTHGQTIFTEGDELDFYYNVTEGVVRILRFLPDGRRTVLDFLFPGDFLGLNASGEYSYTAEALTGVRLCAFPKAKLQRMFEEKPKMESRLLTMFSKKLVASQKQLSDLARKSPRERLAAFLLALSEKEYVSSRKTTFRMPMSREDISDYLGLTVETVSRTLTKLTREGLIRIDQHKTITLLKPGELKNLAESI